MGSSSLFLSSSDMPGVFPYNPNSSLISLPHIFRSLLRCHHLNEAFLTIVKTVTLPLPPYHPMIPSIVLPPPTPHNSSSDIHLIRIKLLSLKFWKGWGARNQIANICWMIKKSRRVPEKHLLLLYWLHQSLWLCGSQETVGNSSRDGNTRSPDLPPEKSECRSRSNS